MNLDGYKLLPEIDPVHAGLDDQRVELFQQADAHFASHIREVDFRLFHFGNNDPLHCAAGAMCRRGEKSPP
jgi:hypothetical protein